MLDPEDGAAIRRVQQLLTKNQLEVGPSTQWEYQDYVMSEDRT